MSSDDKQNDWSQDPSLSGIDFARLQALQQMASQSRGKSQAEMMPFLLSLMQGNQGGAQFSASEADLIISAIKAGKSKQEAAKIDQMVRLFRSAASGKHRCLLKSFLLSLSRASICALLFHGYMPFSLPPI